MDSIITFLLLLNQSLYKIIDELFSQIEELSRKTKTKPFDSKSPEYRKLTVDELPVVKPLEKLDHKLLLIQYQKKKGKPLSPVKSRGGAVVPEGVVCDRCGAPSQVGRGNFTPAVEQARGISPRASLRSGHDSLPSSGSCHPIVGHKPN